MAAANMTQAIDTPAAAFLGAVPDPQRRADAADLAALMARISGEPPVMWGPTIVGFGRYYYRYDSGREGDMCRIGFSPRAKEQVLYILHDTPEEAALLATLGRHRTGRGCLYVKRLDDVDRGVLEALVTASWDVMARRYPG